MGSFNMKKSICLLCIVFMFKGASSQVLIALIFGDKLNTGKIEFGLMTGPGITNISNSQSESKPGFNLGLYFNIRISENFYLHPEAIPKSALGGKGIPVYATPDATVNTLFASGTVERKIKSICVPLLARYRIYKTVFVEAGPQLDWNLKVLDVFKAEASDGNELTYTSKVTSDYNWLSMGLAGGLCWRFKETKSSMSIGFRYYYGLTDLQQSASGTQSHRGSFVFAYIPIGTNKAAKKKQKEQMVN